jgi:hypothetical protein
MDKIEVQKQIFQKQKDGSFTDDAIRIEAYIVISVLVLCFIGIGYIAIKFG